MEYGSHHECPSGPSQGSSNGREDEDDLDLLARVIMESNRYMLGSLGGFSEQRHKDFDEVLKVLSTLRGRKGGCINMDELREECLLTNLGLGGPSLRAVVWKLLLGYLPQRSGDWDATLAELRGNYLNERMGFVHDTVVARESAIEVARRSLTREGQPPQTEDVIEVQRLLDQINKDVYRTRPELVWLDDDRMRAMARGE
ncbi:hypothetical protein FOZ60_015406 [Perkinsus olseni]|uniref:TBC1 domain, member 5 n=1 Tax=Perkinsus olseni TaxID=32597 RepID=A0A7J6N5Y5_PEROL|nr:hypothetical protein FOZ60_015406 [Perkinsus olseni]